MRLTIVSTDPMKSVYGRTGGRVGGWPGEQDRMISRTHASTPYLGEMLRRRGIKIEGTDIVTVIDIRGKVTLQTHHKERYSGN